MDGNKSLIDSHAIFSNDFGEYIEEKRLEKGYNLRNFCNKYGYDFLHQCKIERGIIKPYCSYALLQKLSIDLGIKGQEHKQIVDRLCKTINSPNDMPAIQKNISNWIGSLYVEWCSEEKSERLPWSQRLNNIKPNLVEMLDFFQQEAELPSSVKA